MTSYLPPANKTTAQIQAAWGPDVQLIAMAEALLTRAGGWAPEPGELFFYRDRKDSGLYQITTRMHDGFAFLPLIHFDGSIHPAGDPVHIGWIGDAELQWNGGPQQIIPIPTEAWARIIWRPELAAEDSTSYQDYLRGLSKKLRDMAEEAEAGAASTSFPKAEQHKTA